MGGEAGGEIMRGGEVARKSSCDAAAKRGGVEGVIGRGSGEVWRTQLGDARTGEPGWLFDERDCVLMF